MDGWGIAMLVTWVIMVSALIIYYCRRWRRPSEEGKPRFDERQLMAQGVAYKWGFLTGVFFLLGMVILRIFDDDPDYYLLTILCIISMLLVFVTIAVWKDAYVAIGEKESRLAGFFLAWGILKVIFSGGNLVDLLTGGATLYIACLMWARREVRREEDDF